MKGIREIVQGTKDAISDVFVSVSPVIAKREHGWPIL
jgi:hypothetical protein